MQALYDEELDDPSSESESESSGQMFGQGLGQSGFNFEVPPESFIAEEDIVPDDDEDDPDYIEPMIVSVQLSDRDKLKVCPRASATPRMPVGIEDRSMGDRSLEPMIVAIELGNRNMIPQQQSHEMETAGSESGGEDGRMRRETQLLAEAVSVIKVTALEESVAQSEQAESAIIMKKSADMATSQEAPAPVAVISEAKSTNESANISKSGKRTAVAVERVEQVVENSNQLEVKSRTKKPVVIQTEQKTEVLQASAEVRDSPKAPIQSADDDSTTPPPPPPESMATEQQTTIETAPTFSTEISTSEQPTTKQKSSLLSVLEQKEVEDEQQEQQREVVGSGNGALQMEVEEEKMTIDAPTDDGRQDTSDNAQTVVKSPVVKEKFGLEMEDEREDQAEPDVQKREKPSLQSEDVSVSRKVTEPLQPSEELDDNPPPCPPGGESVPPTVEQTVSEVDRDRTGSVTSMSPTPGVVELIKEVERLEFPDKERKKELHVPAHQTEENVPPCEGEEISSRQGEEIPPHRGEVSPCHREEIPAHQGEEISPCQGEEIPAHRGEEISPCQVEENGERLEQLEQGATEEEGDEQNETTADSASDTKIASEEQHEAVDEAPPQTSISEAEVIRGDQPEQREEEEEEHEQMEGVALLESETPPQEVESSPQLEIEQDLTGSDGPAETPVEDEPMDTEPTSSNEPVKPVDTNIETVDTCMEPVEPDDRYIECAERIEKPAELVEPVDTNIELVNTTSSEPVDTNIESVKPVDTTSTETVDANIEPVKPVYTNIEPVDTDMEPVEPGDRNIEYAEPIEKPAEPVDTNIEPVDTTSSEPDTNIEPVKPVDTTSTETVVANIEPVEPVDTTSTESIDTNIEPVEPVDTASTEPVDTNIELVKPVNTTSTETVDASNIEPVKPVDTSIEPVETTRHLPTESHHQLLEYTPSPETETDPDTGQPTFREHSPKEQLHEEVGLDMAGGDAPQGADAVESTKEEPVAPEVEGKVEIGDMELSSSSPQLPSSAELEPSCRVSDEVLTEQQQSEEMEETVAEETVTVPVDTFRDEQEEEEEEKPRYDDEVAPVISSESTREDEHAAVAEDVIPVVSSEPTQEERTFIQTSPEPMQEEMDAPPDEVAPVIISEPTQEDKHAAIEEGASFVSSEPMHEGVDEVAPIITSQPSIQEEREETAANEDVNTSQEDTQEVPVSSEFTKREAAVDETAPIIMLESALQEENREEAAATESAPIVSFELEEERETAVNEAALAIMSESTPQKEEREEATADESAPVVSSEVTEEGEASVDEATPVIISDRHDEQYTAVDTTVEEKREEDILELTNQGQQQPPPNEPSCTAAANEDPDKPAEQVEESSQTGLSSSGGDGDNPNDHDPIEGGASTSEERGGRPVEEVSRESGLLESGQIEVDVLLHAEEDDLSVFSAEAAEADQALTFTSSHSTGTRRKTHSSPHHRPRQQLPSPPSSSTAPSSSSSSSMTRRLSTSKSSSNVVSPPLDRGHVVSSSGSSASSAAATSSSGRRASLTGSGNAAAGEVPPGTNGEKRPRSEKNEVRWSLSPLSLSFSLSPPCTFPVFTHTPVYTHEHEHVHIVIIVGAYSILGMLHVYYKILH